MKKTLFTVLFVLCLICSKVGAQEKYIFSSDNLHCDDTVMVFTPSNVDGLKNNMPTLFLLHGADGCYRDWANHMDVQALSNETGFRIICPDGFAASWYANHADPNKAQWKDFFWDELWPYCVERFALESKNTFITGLSMGGHGAISIYLDHPEYFKGAGSMSGVLELKYSSQAKTTLPAVFGGQNIEDESCLKEYCVNRLAAYKEALGDKTEEKMIVVTCGSQDKSFLPATDAFTQKCRELGIRHISMTSPGKHAWVYWTWAVRYHLEWFAEEL